MSEVVKKIHPGNDVLPRHLAGGTWKSKILAKKGKRSFTTSKPARLIFLDAPVNGWPGGRPEENGWKPRAGK